MGRHGLVVMTSASQAEGLGFESRVTQLLLWTRGDFTLWSLFTQGSNWGVLVSLSWEQHWTKKLMGRIK